MRLNAFLVHENVWVSGNFRLNLQSSYKTNCILVCKVIYIGNYILPWMLTILQESLILHWRDSQLSISGHAFFQWWLVRYGIDAVTSRENVFFGLLWHQHLSLQWKLWSLCRSAQSQKFDVDWTCDSQGSVGFIEGDLPLYRASMLRDLESSFCYRCSLYYIGFSVCIWTPLLPLQCV